MDKKRSTYNTSYNKSFPDKGREKNPSKKTNVNCEESKVSSSHTQFFQRAKYTKGYRRITTDEYLSDTESISGSSDTFGCVRGPHKEYTETKKLKRFFKKELDPLEIDRNLNNMCSPVTGWEMAKTLEFLVLDPVGRHNTERLEIHLRDFAKTSRSGFKIDVLNGVCVILDYLVENLNQIPNMREGVVLLMKNMDKPIFLPLASDISTQFDTLQHYIGFLAYLLLRVEDDELFDLVSRGLLRQLSPSEREAGTVSLRHALGAAASPALYHATVRQLSVASSRRFPTFLNIALLLAAASTDNCIEMIKENIIENIFYRFNPYQPERSLPNYEMIPAYPQDQNLKLGDSSIHMSTTLSLLLILLNTMKIFLDENDHYRKLLPAPDYYSQRCFIWAYRYECRAREHRHERITMTAVTHALLHCFRDRLTAFSTLLMPDIMALSVLTEIPQKVNWTGTVNFNTAQLDVQFKKMLIYLSVAFLKVYPSNRFMVESQHWLLGLMFLLDPGLCHLRARWSSPLFSEIRKTALQALVCTLPLMRYTLIQEYGLIRRLMWYVEWYCDTPYELPVLYWCMRLLQVATATHDSPARPQSIRDLFDTHGIIILMHLCYKLLEQQSPPLERVQVVLSLALRLLTNAAGQQAHLRCCVYPQLIWPDSGNALSRTMLDVALFALDKNYIVSDRWLISLLNFIWEAIIWKKEYIQKFVLRNGVFNLLDLTSMSSASVQCLALAVLCEALNGAQAVAQVIAWRAPQGATASNTNVVKRGGTIASLIASVFRDECLRNGVSLDKNGVIQDLDSPLLCVYKRASSGPSTAFELAGSRMSKAFTLFHLLSEDLAYKVSMADESLNLYKNIILDPEEETILILCSHYLTLKLNETWMETKMQIPNLLPQDEESLNECIEISKGWAKVIKRQQEDVLERHGRKEAAEELSLYSLVARARLGVALDALQVVRCSARSAMPSSAAPAFPSTAAISTYHQPLDDQNVTGQYVRVRSIEKKNSTSKKLLSQELFL